MTSDDFAVLILSHGRADNVKTVRTLDRGGYTGKWFIVVDDEDDQKPEYVDRFGCERVVEFSKEEAARITDTMDARPDRGGVVFARNACWGIAEGLGLTHFLVLDDDYSAIEHRYDDGGKLRAMQFPCLDEVFEAFCRFLDVSGALTVAMAQGGDFIGGVGSRNFRSKVLRKAMNSFFCRTDRPFRFSGRVNEDTTAYAMEGNRGGLFLTVADASVTQTMTQKAAGGLTGLYLENGTYVKSFYSVMAVPSAVKVSAMGDKHVRAHHRIDWDSCVPKLLSDRWCKHG